MEEHCYWAAYLKFAAAAAAAGPDEGAESRTTHKLFPTSNQIPSASSQTEETRHVFHYWTCNSPTPAGSRLINSSTSAK